MTLEARHKTGPGGQRVVGGGGGRDQELLHLGQTPGQGWGCCGLWGMALGILLTAPATGREPVRMEIFPGGL